MSGVAERGGSTRDEEPYLISKADASGDVIDGVKRQTHNQRGATLVEAAIVTLPFMLVVFAILEFGMAFRTDLTIENAAQRGGRAASVGGTSVSTDFQILEAIQAGLDDGGLEGIQRVIVYKATAPNDPVPAGCLAITNPIGPNGVNGSCNVYGPDAFTAPLETSPGVANDEWQCLSPGARDDFWCPDTREASFSLGPRDYVGVYLETTHQYVTGLFGSEVGLDAAVVSRLEPEEQ